MSDPVLQKMFEAAKKARDQSHSPYSDYAVGAAVLAGGEIFSGCNIENSSYGLTLCAERVAIAKAVSEGKKRIDRILVLTENKAAPCGACRQTMIEFSQADTEVWLAGPQEIGAKLLLGELVPLSFSAADLTKVKKA